jgi:hypothetical protein
MILVLAGEKVTPSADNTVIRIRYAYSQSRLTGHDFLSIGTGGIATTNYPGEPTQAASQANEVIEEFPGRVFYVSTDQDGNFRVGDYFRVDQATGRATLNASAFDLSGLTSLRLGSIGAQLGELVNEFSSDDTLSGNSNAAVPTEAAIRGYFEKIATSVLPATDLAVDLGSPTKRWREIYVGAGSIKLGTLTISDVAGKLAVTTATPGANAISTPTPINPTDAANKAYVDEVAQGIIAKPSVRAATTTNLAANYSNGTDGVGATLTADTNRAFGTLDTVTNWAVTTPPMGVLVKNQTNSAHNGRYNLTTLGSGSTPWVLTKCGLCDEADEIPGAYVFVAEGTQAGTGWIQTVADPDTFVVGTDSVIVVQFSGAGTFTAGTGLTLTESSFSVNGSQTFTDVTLNAEGTVKFADTDSSNWVAFKAPATVAANVTWTLPAADSAVSGYALVSNASGVLSWAAAGAAITDDTTSTLLYPSMAAATTGNLTDARVSSTKFTFNAATGTLTTIGLVESSSISLKENVMPITNALDSILQLCGVTYDRRDGSKKNEAGLIAEDVNNVLPNLIAYDADGKPSGINYTKLSAYLIEAVKTLKGEIDTLKGIK